MHPHASDLRRGPARGGARAAAAWAAGAPVTGNATSAAAVAVAARIAPLPLSRLIRGWACLGSATVPSVNPDTRPRVGPFVTFSLTVVS